MWDERATREEETREHVGARTGNVADEYTLSRHIMGGERRRCKLCNMRKYIHKTLSAFAYLWQVNARCLAGV